MPCRSGDHPCVHRLGAQEGVHHGFAVLLPFLVIDMVISNILLSLGMFMLPPVVISLPFKILLFVLAGGWTMVVKFIVMGFNY